MTKPIVKIHNVATGEIIEREMTADELAQAAIDEANFNALKQAEAIKVATKNALLTKLGLTADEVAALLG